MNWKPSKEISIYPSAKCRERTQIVLGGCSLYHASQNKGSPFSFVPHGKFISFSGSLMVRQLVHNGGHLGTDWQLVVERLLPMSHPQTLEEMPRNLLIYEVFLASGACGCYWSWIPNEPSPPSSLAGLSCLFYDTSMTVP